MFFNKNYDCTQIFYHIHIANNRNTLFIFHVYSNEKMIISVFKSNIYTYVHLYLYAFINIDIIKI